MWGKKMNKLKYAVAGLALVLAGCQYNEYYYEEDTLNVENNVTTAEEKQKVTATAIPAQKEEKAESVSKTEEAKPVKTQDEVEVMHPDEPLEKLAYDSAYDRFLDNVIIKVRSDNYITYEYKDVRVDELAPLASRYCQEHGNRTAVLRSVTLYKNYARHATFDCLRLQ